jgi:UDP-glucose 4-epimerase
MFDNKILLITGGTGSFGNAVLTKFIDSSLKEIRIFSRDEKKQDDMRKKYRSKKIKFFIGDVRDKTSLHEAIADVDYIFHAAALKQVPSCEFFPHQALQTNVIGTENVLEVAIANNVKKVICLSTDKAVYPINVMGITKALMEKVAIAKSRISHSTEICITRYGNVMGSRGSVIPLFCKQLASGEPLTITNKHMTRFMMTLDDAVSLVLYAFEHGGNGDIFIQKSPACSIGTLASALIKIKDTQSKILEIGTRHGEKEYEVLCGKEEIQTSVDLGSYIKIPPDNRDLNYHVFEDQGHHLKPQLDEYHSSNTTILNENEMINLLKKINLDIFS